MVEMLLANQARQLQNEIAEQKSKLDKLTELSNGLTKVKDFSVESIGDIVLVMNNRKKLWKLRRMLIIIGIPLEIAEIGSFIYGLMAHNWWPFAGVMLTAIPICIWMSRRYLQQTSYICPKCHTVFHPKTKDVLWARHTPNTRLLTCPDCGYHNFCIETFNPDIEEEN